MFRPTQLLGMLCACSLGAASGAGAQQRDSLVVIVAESAVRQDVPLRLTVQPPFRVQSPMSHWREPVPPPAPMPRVGVTGRIPPVPMPNPAETPGGRPVIGLPGRIEIVPLPEPRP
jgi:hypothetical protein